MKTCKDKQLLQTIKKKTHFVAATYACYFAQKHSHSKQHTFQALVAFFFSPIDEYSRTAGSGSAKTANVMARKEIMMELMQGKYDEELSIPNTVDDV